MTAAEIIALRTSMTTAQATSYAELAEQKVREYLRYKDEDDLDAFVTTVADVAILYFQRDTQVSSLTENATLKSESFSEGGVSVSKGYLTAADVNSSYDGQVLSVLNGIARYRRARVVKDVQNADAG